MASAVRAMASSYAIGAKPAGLFASRVQRGQQAVGVRALQVTLDALGAEHPPVEGKVIPRLKADDFVVLHLQLNAALLAAKAAVRLDKFVRLGTGIKAHPLHVREVWPELLDRVDLVGGRGGH